VSIGFVKRLVNDYRHFSVAEDVGQSLRSGVSGIAGAQFLTKLERIGDHFGSFYFAMHVEKGDDVSARIGTNGTIGIPRFESNHSCPACPGSPAISYIEG
jgi:hypothetical protein